MSGFYEKLSELHPDYDTLAVTFVEGEHIGEKALFSKGELIYETVNGVFPRSLQKLMIETHMSGLLQIGGQRIFCEILGSEKKLVICGAGHVSIPIIRMGKMLEFQVTVIEDRPLYADHARNALADEVLCDDFCHALSTIKGDPDTYFVIVTRGHRYDLDCLEEILLKSSAYIGMIGSRVRVKRVKDLLIEKGFEEERLNKIYAPIGLAIGAETPEEIAVAIMAEIIQVKNHAKRSGGYSKEIKKAIYQEDTGEMPKILATIVSRKGSAPREVGTKMLILKDGTTVGTIGGGCVEADVCRKAHSMLAEDNEKAKLYSVDMTGRDAEEEGMVCGGVVEILLERIS